MRVSSYLKNDLQLSGKIGPHISTFSFIAFLLLMCAQIQAQESNDKTKRGVDAKRFRDASKRCERIYSDNRIDVLRGKIDIWGERPSEDERFLMSRNLAKPSEDEKNALRVFAKLQIACDKILLPALSNSDTNAAVEKFGKTFAAKISPLLDGTMTYGEYWSQQNDAAITTFKDMTKGTVNDSNAYERKIQTWLAPEMAKYQSDSPWWDLYAYAIFIARDVDAFAFNANDAHMLIEKKRIEINARIASAAASKVVTLNCALSGGSNMNLEKAFILDYSKTTVNGYPASISENEIRWSFNMPDGTKINNILNRLSGFMQMGTETATNMFSGRCEPASKKF